MTWQNRKPLRTQNNASQEYGNKKAGGISTSGRKKGKKMQNLKTETIELLKENGKTVDDVRFVRTSGAEIPLDVFWKEADKNYDDGYGGAEVNESLMVVGDDWWMERHEYDGSEWWEFKSLPSRPPVADADADFSRLVFSESFFW